MALNIHTKREEKKKRLIRDGEKGGWGEGGMEVRRGKLYTYRYTVTTRRTPALRWAVVRAILISHFNV